MNRVTQSLVRELTLTLRDAFIDYNTRFGQITRRAKRRFEQRNWSAGRADAVERIDLYERCVAAAVAEITELTAQCDDPQALLAAVKNRAARDMFETIASSGKKASTLPSIECRMKTNLMALLL